MPIQFEPMTPEELQSHAAALSRNVSGKPWDKGFTELRRVLGVSRDTIWRWNSGRVPVPEGYARQIRHLRKYGYDIERYLNDTAKPYQVTDADRKRYDDTSAGRYHGKRGSRVGL